MARSSGKDRRPKFAKAPISLPGAPLPPAAAQGGKELRGVEIALRLGADKAHARLLGQALRVEHLEDADIAEAVGGLRQLQIGFRRFERAALRLNLFKVVLERLQ